MNYKEVIGSIGTFAGATLFLLLASIGVFAQNPAATSKPTMLAGQYEGSAKGPNGDVTLKLELTEQAGKYSGRVISPREVHQIIKGSFADGTLSLELDSKGKPAKLILKEKDGTLAGELTLEGQTGPVEFHRVTLDQISGDWDGAADAQGQAFPFTLTLKVDGEKVTGSSSSELGTSTISSGIWKDGKLTIVLEAGSGQIGMVATLQEGKLVGDYDFAGQMQGKWVAVKKK